MSLQEVGAATHSRSGVPEVPPRGSAGARNDPTPGGLASHSRTRNVPGLVLGCVNTDLATRLSCFSVFRHLQYFLLSIPDFSDFQDFAKLLAHINVLSAEFRGRQQILQNFMVKNRRISVILPGVIAKMTILERTFLKSKKISVISQKKSAQF